MIQNSIIAIIVIVCAWFIGRRIYRNLKGTQQGCGCDCSGCSTDMLSTCESPDKKTESE